MNLYDHPTWEAELEALPTKVRAERQRRGLSHRTAAFEIGMAYADLCRFEQGKKDVRLSTVLKLVGWLQLSTAL